MQRFFSGISPLKESPGQEEMGPHFSTSSGVYKNESSAPELDDSDNALVIQINYPARTANTLAIRRQLPSFLEL